MSETPATVQFEYSGEADRVELATFMPRFPKDIAFSESHGVWRLTIPLPHQARIEYRLKVTRHGHTTVIRDPSNPVVATNPFGSNSVMTGSGYHSPEWLSPEAPAGTVSTIRVASAVFGKRRTHHLYQPAGFSEDTPLPLLMVHDGSDYWHHADLGRALDVLIAHRRIEPLRAVLLDPKARHAEYIASRDHATHVVNEVFPHVARRVSLDGPHGIMGASLGAVAALHTAYSYPGMFDRVFLQSGTFALEPHPELTDEMFRSINAFCLPAMRHSRLGSARVAISCGRYESLIDWNRRLAAALADQFVDVDFVEVWAGHDWGAWRDRFQTGLEFLYPGSDE
jgi:enterochelin esterase-like enzyme